MRGTGLRESAPQNCATRAEAEEALRALLRGFCAAQLRVLVGWDCPLGYPVELAELLSLGGPRGVWELLARELRDEGNRSNRFELAAALNARLRGACPRGGPFWACPGRVLKHPAKAAAIGGLTARRPPPGALPEWRLCELALRAAGVRPHSVWKLYTAGSCGSQALTGIPRMLRLRDDAELAARSCVWPFETGFALPEGAQIVHAECWPGAVGVDRAAHAVKDAAQVLSLVRWAAQCDARGLLAARFGPPPLDAAQLARARAEGWILA